MRCPLWLVPVVLRKRIHVSGRGVDRRLIGALAPAGWIQHCIIFKAAAICVDVAYAVAAAVCICVVAGIVVPHSGGRRRVAGHGIAGIRAMFARYVPEWKLSILVELLELGTSVLEPDFDLEQRTFKNTLCGFVTKLHFSSQEEAYLCKVLFNAILFTTPESFLFIF